METLTLDSLENIDVFSKEEEVLSSSSSSFSLSLRRDNFADDKEFKKFVNKCKRLIRQSPEYSDWVDYLREVMGEQVCAFTKETNSQTSVEIHHHPICLDVIVRSIIKSHLVQEKAFCAFDICTEIIKMHYDNKIGFVPLVGSLHEKFHNGYLEIPIEFIKGNYELFLEQYKSMMEEEDKELIEQRIKVTKENSNWGSNSWNPEQ